MAPFSIPAPCIIPLRVPVFGTRRTVDTETKIELMCETCIEHEIFYTLDGTRPQPYAGIIQGSKLRKYQSPFYLPAGKVTIKAIALSSRVRSMRSNVVTKCFEVLKSESDLSKDVPSKKKKALRKTAVEPEVPLGGVKINDKEEDIVDSTSDKGKDLYVEDPCSSVEDFCLAADIPPGNDGDASDSSSQSGLSAVLERDNPLNDAKYESELVTPNPSPARSVPQSPTKGRQDLEEGQGDSKDIMKVESEDHNCSANSESHPCCIKCNTSLQFCLACSAPNISTSKYCIQCGQQLMQNCGHCQEFNYVIATFCQFCGKKLKESVPNIKGVDCSTMAKPQRTHASVQQTPTSLNKQTQTLPERKDARKSQRLPSCSPGRGYWHQQLDYICNHLKSYAYNNNEFRESISEPMLSEFHTAKVVKSEDSISVTLVFAPLNLSEKM